MTNNRYIRQYTVPGFGPEAQERLAQKTVAVVGAGGLGCPVLTQLVGAGAGHVILIENDIVQLSNLPRQSLYTTVDIGRSKTEVAGERLSARNPEISFVLHNTRLSAENALDILAPADLVIDCSDNFSTRYLINDACVILNKPWAFGAIERWVGQYAVFNYPAGAGPTYRCIFPEPPVDAPDCNEAGVLPPLPAVIGSYMANAALQVLAGIPHHNLQGRLFTFDLQIHTSQALTFRRDHESVSSLTSLDGAEYNSPFCVAGGIEVSAEAYLADPGLYELVDIREEFEYESNPSRGINIPYHTLLAKPQVLSTFSKPVLLACETGKRSLLTARKISESGLGLEIKSLAGGLSRILG